MLTLTCGVTAFKMTYNARGNIKTLNIRKTATTTTKTTTATITTVTKKILKTAAKPL